MHVGDDVVVGDGCAGYLHDVVLDLIADVSHVVGALILVASCCTTTAVLEVCVMCLDLEFEVVFGEVIVSFDVDRLLLPFHHFSLVEHVGVVHLLKIELEFVIVRDGDVGSDEGSLVVIKSFAKRSKVLVAVPLCKVGIFEFLFCLHIERAPC